MSNERLRDALLRNGLTFDQVSKALRVDRKTVERWVTKGRTPYPKHRHAIATMTYETENYLWPQAVTSERKVEIGNSEVIKVYPHRHSAPTELWDRLLGQASKHIEILIYSGMFLTDNPGLVERLRDKAERGARIRIMIGDPASQEVRRRGAEEGIGRTTLAAKARNALAFYKPLDGVQNAQVRMHSTTLYNSLYRFDDELLVNTHVYGFMAGHAPLLHLRRLSGGDLFETYSDSFESVWSTSKLPKW